MNPPPASPQTADSQTGPKPADATAEAPAGAAPRRIGEREFVALMALLQALQALAIDAMLPALGPISADLGAGSANQRQLVVGLFLIFSGLGSLIPGPLADRYGRRPIVLSCLGAYVAFSAACALVSHFLPLLVLRAALGLACAGLTVLPAAIIRDRLEGDRMARLQSMVSMVFMIVPMFAPTLGQAVLVVAGWRWIFGVMALLGALLALWVRLRLPETLRPEFRQPIRPGRIVATLGAVLKSRMAMGYVLGMALIQGALFGYINSTQQLLGEHFGAGARFPLFFGGMALAMASTNFINSRIVLRFGARRVSHAALLTYGAVALVQLLLAVTGLETLWRFVPLMTLNLCLMAFIGANFTSIALQPFARIAGAAAGGQAFVRMVLASSLGAAIGQAYDGTARPLAGALVLAGAGALALVLFGEEGRLFRRLHPPQPE